MHEVLAVNQATSARCKKGHTVRWVQQSSSVSFQRKRCEDLNEKEDAPREIIFAR
jgi:hypothetical protein